MVIPQFSEALRLNENVTVEMNPQVIIHESVDGIQFTSGHEGMVLPSHGHGDSHLAASLTNSEELANALANHGEGDVQLVESLTNPVEGGIRFIKEEGIELHEGLDDSEQGDSFRNFNVLRRAIFKKNYRENVGFFEKLDLIDWNFD